ncbi:HNH endonuclease signature motif containing protein, partial [Sporichthya sp.]|uniref:HNH endonuclease signature motif containing protein n=1 Tax=Sporichthya sp. TaxID=65475 RepID=UPI0017F23F10
SPPASSPPASDAAAEEALKPAPESTWAGVHLKVRLSTLLGLDRYPGELAGWGSAHAELARQMVDQLGAAQWRYTLTCPEGYLIRTGLTNARPSTSRKRQASCQAVVEIVVPAALLPQLLSGDLAATIAPDLLKAWGPVIFDLHERLTDLKTQRLLDPRRRAPGAALRREVIAAIKTCVGPGCRAPAGRGDIDHRKDWAKGGDTVQDNLNPMCRHNHRLKTEAGWQLRRIADTFEWTTRLGHVYLVPVPPVLPHLPEQQPSPAEEDLSLNGDRDQRGEPWQRSTAWDETRHLRAEPQPPTPPRPRPDHDDDPLPF